MIVIDALVRRPPHPTRLTRALDAATRLVVVVALAVPIGILVAKLAG